MNGIKNEYVHGKITKYLVESACEKLLIGVQLK